MALLNSHKLKFRKIILYKIQLLIGKTTLFDSGNINSKILNRQISGRFYKKFYKIGYALGKNYLNLLQNADHNCIVLIALDT